jgi:hypothetical protein
MYALQYSKLLHAITNPSIYVCTPISQIFSLATATPLSKMYALQYPKFSRSRQQPIYMYVGLCTPISQIVLSFLGITFLHRVCIRCQGKGFIIRNKRVNLCHMRCLLRREVSYGIERTGQLRRPRYKLVVVYRVVRCVQCIPGACFKACQSFRANGQRLCTGASLT